MSCALPLLVKKLAVIKNNSAVLEQRDDNLWVRMKEQKVQQQQQKVMIIRSKNKTNLGCLRATVELMQKNQTNKTNALNGRNLHKVLLKCNYGMGYNLSS